MTRTFGHRHFTLIFRPLLTIEDGGFTFRAKHYSWSDVAKIETFDPRRDWTFMFLTYPRALITLNDGSRIVSVRPRPS